VLPFRKHLLHAMLPAYKLLVVSGGAALSAREYHRVADTCAAIAIACSDPETRVKLYAIARLYRRLAEQTERNAEGEVLDSSRE
jgi:hypothetical protein